MKILLTSIFLICMYFVVFTSCKSHQATKDETRKSLTKLPKDSLKEIIISIAEYLAQPNPSDSGLNKLLQSSQNKYDISVNNPSNKSFFSININSYFDKSDDYQKNVIITSDGLDSLNWFSMNDLIGYFGNYELGVYDEKMPKPKEVGWNGVFKIVISREKITYLFVHAERMGKSNYQVKSLTLRTQKHSNY